MFEERCYSNIAVVHVGLVSLLCYLVYNYQAASQYYVDAAYCY